MPKFIIQLFLTLLIAGTAIAQQPKSREQLELERKRQEIKNEIEQTQQQLDKNKKVTKENLTTLLLVRRKLDLQNAVIDNINHDLNLLDNNIYRSQKDINKLSLLLDTLKREYARSMVYAYKNRSNSDFLNFIFSASSFNDAIKRITYLKSYRAYREMQGENILRTQQLLQGRVQELNGTKVRKGEVLETQNKEVEVLAVQEKEKDQVVAQLKAQGKELNAHIAASKKQMAKVSAAIAIAIKKAIADAQAAARAEALKKKNAEIAAANANPNKSSTPVVKTKPKAITKQQENFPLNGAEIALNANFENNKGSLPWPVDKGYVMVHYGTQKLEGVNLVIDNPGITIGCDIGASVKAVFDGEVSSITPIDNMLVVMVKHGRYFSVYSNVTGVTVSKGQTVHTGQVVGHVLANDEGVGSIDLIITKESSNTDPERWLRRR